jgi:hypothetical protein
VIAGSFEFMGLLFTMALAARMLPIRFDWHGFSGIDALALSPFRQSDQFITHPTGGRNGFVAITTEIDVMPTCRR